MSFQRAHALFQFTLAANQLRQFFGKGFQALVSLIGGVGTVYIALFTL